MSYELYSYTLTNCYMSSVFSSLWAVINYFYYDSSSHAIYVNLSNFSDKMFPALGFGAKLPDGTVSHEFFMVCRLYTTFIVGL